MDVPDDLKKRIIEAVQRFECEQLSVVPEVVSVDLAEGNLIVTLRGLGSPAERSCAREPASRELLERFYRELFDAIRPGLEQAVGRILRQAVERSTLTVDAESGNGLLLFVLSDEGAR